MYQYYKSISQISNDVKFDLSKYLCIKPNSTHIQGFWGGEKNTFLFIEIRKCSNSTDIINEIKPKCKSAKEINDNIQYVSFYIRNTIIQPNDFENPVKYILTNNYRTINTYLSYNIVIWLKQLDFIEDLGLFFEETYIRTSFYYDTIENQFSNDNSIVANFQVKHDRIGRKIYRNYLKIQDVLTNLGGLIKIITLFAYILSYSISKIEFSNDIYEYYHNRYERISKSNHMSHIKNIKNNDNPKNNIKSNEISINDSDKSRNFNENKGKSNIELVNKPSISKFKSSNNMPMTFNVNVNNIKYSSISSVKNEISSKTIVKNFFKTMFNRNDRIAKEKRSRIEKIFLNCMSIETIVQKFFEIEYMIDVLRKRSNDFQQYHSQVYEDNHMDMNVISGIINNGNFLNEEIIESKFVEYLFENKFESTDNNLIGKDIFNFKK